MAKNPVPLDIQDGFDGGWNLHNGLGMARNQYALGSDCRISEDGRLRSRQGSRRLHASAQTGGGGGTLVFDGYSWRLSTGIAYEIFIVSGKPYRASYADGSGPALSSITALNGSAIFSTSNHASFAAFRSAGTEYVYIADGASTGGGKGLSRTDATTCTDHNVGPTGVNIAFIWVYNDRLYGVTGANNVLYYSAVGDGDTLGVVASGGGFLTVRAFSGQQLTGGIAIGSTNVLFHRGAISAFRGSTTDDINIDTGAEGISASIGIPIPRAVIAFDRYAYAWTTQGAAILSESGVTLLDQPGRPDPLVYDTETFSGGFLASATTGAWVVQNTRMKEIWFGAAGGYPTYIWSYRYNCWVGKHFFHFTAAITSIWETVSGSTLTGYPQILFGSVDGFVRGTDFKEQSGHEVYLDDVTSAGTGGSFFQTSVQCRRFWGPDWRPHKIWQGINVCARLNEGALVLTSTGQNAVVGVGIVSDPTTSYLNPEDYAGFPTDGVPRSSQYLDVLVAFAGNKGTRIETVNIEGDLTGNRGI